MKAAVCNTYGSPDVLGLEEVKAPRPGGNEVMIRVLASPVTEGDRRIRAADFPGFTWLPGRLMVGLWGPRHRVQGTAFAGEVVVVGKDVTRFKKGDRVFGACMHGAQAEWMTMPEEGAMARMPESMTFEEASSLPYGAMTALVFLRDLGKVKRGDRVLVVGASGGVGRFAVQIARHLGAEVTGVCSRNQDLVRALGASEVIDHREEDFTQGEGAFDVIFDLSGVVDFAACRRVLSGKGRFLSVYMTAGVLWDMARTSWSSGQSAHFGMVMGTREDMEELRALVELGAVSAVIDRTFSLEQIAEAHARLEEKPRGSVVVKIPRAPEPVPFLMAPMF